jgi:hypothetical protein
MGRVKTKTKKSVITLATVIPTRAPAAHPDRVVDGRWTVRLTFARCAPESSSSVTAPSPSGGVESVDFLFQNRYFSEELFAHTVKGLSQLNQIIVKRVEAPVGAIVLVLVPTLEVGQLLGKRVELGRHVRVPETAHFGDELEEKEHAASKLENGEDDEGVHDVVRYPVEDSDCWLNV